MAVSVTLTDVQRVTTTGRVYVRFADGFEWEFPSAQAAREFIRALDDPDEDGLRLARMLLILWWLKRNPTGNNPALVEGKTLTFDLTASPVLQVS